jgi:hypothetical protein
MNTQSSDKAQGRTLQISHNRFLQNYYYLNCQRQSVIVSLNALYLITTCILVYWGVTLQFDKSTFFGVLEKDSSNLSQNALNYLSNNTAPYNRRP